MIMTRQIKPTKYEESQTFKQKFKQEPSDIQTSKNDEQVNHLQNLGKKEENNKNHKAKLKIMSLLLIEVGNDSLKHEHNDVGT